MMKMMTGVNIILLARMTVRHVTENDQDYLRKIPRVVVQNDRGDAGMNIDLMVRMTE
jgi:hypothetical protein